MSRGRKEEDDYKFMQIVDALAAINQRVNLIGVVIETSLPKHSKGTDYFCHVKIIGETRPNVGIRITFYAESVDTLPHIESFGDIIMISQVTMRTRGSEVYAQYNKRSSSFALYKRSDYGRAAFKPYQISTKFIAREQDKKLIKELREWLTHHKFDDLNNFSALRGIKEGELVNLLCKILHVCEIKKNEWMLFVWDGTDTPPAIIEAKLEDEMENPLPLHIEPSPLSRDLLCTFPPVGTVLRMVVDQNNEKIGIKFVHANKWVKFMDINCKALAGLWHAVMLPSSRFCYLPDDDDRVVEHLRLYNERVPSKWGRMPFTCFPSPSKITETDHPDVPFVTLMNVLTHPEVTCKFKCSVRVVAILPCRGDEFRSPNGIYRVRLTLEDPTARIHAFIYAEDGVKFFGTDHSADTLTRKRDILLGVGEGDSVSRNPPWIQCCLKSYYIDESDLWGSRNYRIFDTTLVG